MSGHAEQTTALTNSAPLIVAGVDGSASSRAALRWAVGQARLTGATVDAVIAWQVQMVATSSGSRLAPTLLEFAGTGWIRYSLARE